MSIFNKRRHPQDLLINILIYLATAILLIVVLGIFVITLVQGLPSITWEFLTTKPSVLNNTIGILPSIINTVYLIIITLVIVIPIGVGASIYLNEYAKKGHLLNVIQSTTETLAGIPSIIYGLFGAIFFGVLFGLGYSIMAGALTMAIMTLPIVIRTTQEALKSVPEGYREGALGLGATKWYMLRTIILPAAMPGIITSVILCIGRISAESAALIFTAGIGTNLPKNLFTHPLQSGSTLTVELYQYAANRGDNKTAFGIALILLLIVLALNIITRIISKKGRKRV